MKLRRYLLIATFLAGCTAPNWAKQALDDAGYDEVKLTGYKPFRCGEDDLTATGFEATNIRGKRVSGVVCCGALKDCTIRH